MISVETLVAEKFPRFVSQRPLLTRPTVAFLRKLFHESEFKRFESNYPYLKGFDFIDQVLDYFDYSYTVKSREKERIPVSGRVVIVANHPVGSLDGLSLLKMISEVRSDVKVVANEMLMAVKPLHPLLLPVDNNTSKTARQSIRAIESHLNNEGALIIFPAGQVSRLSAKGIKDCDWNSGFLRFATKTRSPILPVFVNARNSIFFYSLSMLAKPVSTLWLVREMFKQATRGIQFSIGKPISFEQYDGLPMDLKARSKLFRRHVYKLQKNKGEACFADDIEMIAHPEPTQQLRDELAECQMLGRTADNKCIYLYRYQGDSAVMREMGRLREISFRAVGEGTGKRRDIDRYDALYDHIILWDDQALQLVGAYRLIKTASLIQQQGVPALYTSTLFDYQPGAQPYLSQAVELGRSFVQPAYWGKRSLDYLWYGIGAYLKTCPEIRYLLGPVSLSNSYAEKSRCQIVSLYKKYFAASEHWAVARLPYQGTDEELYTDMDYTEAFKQLKKNLAENDAVVPVLYKQYSEICEPGGVQFVDFNIDESFSNCVDGLVVVDLNYLKQTKRQRYLGD
jgi:putative hemolysin